MIEGITIQKGDAMKSLKLAFIVFALHMQQVTPMDQSATSYIRNNFPWMKESATREKTQVDSFDKGLNKKVSLSLYSTEAKGFTKDGIFEKKIKGTGGLAGLLAGETPLEDEYLICTTVNLGTPRCFGRLGRSGPDTFLYQDLHKQFEDAYEARARERLEEQYLMS